MQEFASIEERVRDIAERAAAERGVELAAVETATNGRDMVWRVFIDKPDGVTHEDCAEVSRHIGAILDVEDFIHAHYTLEVSSPGLERGLYKRADYERFTGSLAKIKSRTPVGNQRNFRGRIIGVEGEADAARVVFDDKTSGRVELPLDSIVKANLEIDIEEEFRRSKAAAEEF